MFKLDSGADANVLPLDTCERLGSGAPLKKLSVVNPHTFTSEAMMFDFYVTRATDIAITGWKSCIKLDLVRRVSVDTVAENYVHYSG